jgi:hypothetical protein
VLTLYRSSNLSSYWVAHSESLGWVMFPARANGWGDRKPNAGETAALQRIPQRLGFNTGFPHPDATPVRAINEQSDRLFAQLGPSPRRRVA